MCDICLKLLRISSCHHSHSVPSTGMASWSTGWQANSKQKADWGSEDPPKNSGGTWNSGWGSPPRWENHPASGWSQSRLGPDAEPAASSSSDSWQLVKSDAAATGSDDPWMKADPWQGDAHVKWSATASSRSSDDTKYSQPDTQQSVDALPPPTYCTPYGTMLPPPFTAFGSTAHRRQKAEKTIKPQWKKGPVFIDFGLTPEKVRTPRCHRLKHKQPAEIRQTMKGFPKLWREVKNAEDTWKKLKHKVDEVAGMGTNEMPTKIRAAAKKCFEDWLEERCMGDMRVVENVTVNHEALSETLIIPGFKWADFEHTPSMPETLIEDKWDLYLTDFATDCYAPLAAYLDSQYSMKDGVVQLPDGIWLRYHGMNMYALSSILATNHAIPSDKSIKAAETACGRGVYTSREWSKARQYAIPHQLPKSEVLTKVIALFVIPGASGEGGAAVWMKKKLSVWTEKEKGRWVGRQNWFLVPEDAVEDQCWEKPGCSEAIPFPDLQKRTDGKRVPGLGEVPWTTMNDTSDEDQSSVVHLAGFFVTHCNATSARRMTCKSREGMFFAGWDEALEPPVGRRTASWDDIAPRDGRPTAEEIKKQSETARAENQKAVRASNGAFDSGSSVAGSPRAEATPAQNIQIRTYQDDTGDAPLGSLMKLPGCPMWLVYRNATAGEWCLLCAKESGIDHTGSIKHKKKLLYVDHFLNEWKYPFL